MDRIQKITRRGRVNRIKERTQPLRVALNEPDYLLVKRKLEERGIGLNVLFEAVCRGFVSNHPAVTAMLDDWMRERTEADGRPKLFHRQRDIDSIYDAIGNTIEDAGE